MLQKCALLLSLWLVMQSGTGCSAGLKENQIIPTPPASDPSSYCASIIDDLSTPDSQAAWSPNGERYAIVDSGCGVVVDTVQERTWAMPLATGPGFWRWTADSRFAIFRYQNAKGNSITYVFDAVMWKFERTSGCPVIQTGSLMAWASCGDYPIALAPNAPRFLMENGSLVNLPGLQSDSFSVFWDADHQSVLSAEWSPDGNYLAFVTGNYPYEGGTLYIAQGDGKRAQQSVSFEGYHTLQWAADGKSVAVETEINRYILDIATMQVQVVSASAPP
jgi:dipeptidyl aminopeptidase/acylaminoacyl peptidase